MPEKLRSEHVEPGLPLSLPAGVSVSPGSLDAAGRRCTIVAAQFNTALVDRLIEGSVECLLHHGASASDLRVLRVPGAWELPLALEGLATAGGWDSLVALGVVIRGETAHFDFICAEASRGIAEVSERHRLPVGFGLLTCETAEQALARCGGDAGNKGWEAAEAAIWMTNTMSHLRGSKGATGRG